MILGHGDLGDLSHLPDEVPSQAPGQLDPADFPDLNRYTGSAYRDLNSFLRSGDVGAGHTVESLEKLAEGVSDDLARLPEHPGHTKRGTWLSDDLLNDIHKDGPFVDNGFFSTSTDPAVADSFMRMEGGNTLFHVDGHSGRGVSGVSHHSGEAEVLYDRGTDFRVVDKVWNENGGYWDIWLEERK